MLLDKPVPIEGGWRVKATELYFVDILKMTNLRIVLTPKDDPRWYETGWCYQEPFELVVLRANMLDPDSGEEPVGWIKQTGTERRACGWYYKGPRLHRGYEADCDACGNEGLR